MAFCCIPSDTGECRAVLRDFIFKLPEPLIPRLHLFLRPWAPQTYQGFDNQRAIAYSPYVCSSRGSSPHRALLRSSWLGCRSLEILGHCGFAGHGEKRICLKPKPFCYSTFCNPLLRSFSADGKLKLTIKEKQGDIFDARFRVWGSVTMTNPT